MQYNAIKRMLTQIKKGKTGEVVLDLLMLIGNDNLKKKRFIAAIMIMNF